MNNSDSQQNSTNNHFRHQHHHYHHRYCHHHRPRQLYTHPPLHQHPHRSTSQTSSLVNRFLDIDTAFLDDVFPFNLIPSLRHVIDATWRCFQFRYQLFPICFPGGECNVGESEQQRQQQRSQPCHPLPSSVDLHGENVASTQPAHMFMHNCGVSPERGPCGGSSLRQRSSLTRTCSMMNTCHCCTCSCYPQGSPYNQNRSGPFVSRIRPCPQHATILDGLEGPRCPSPHVRTRAAASGVNLNIRVLTSTPSDCSSIEAPRKVSRKSTTIHQICQCQPSYTCLPKHTNSISQIDNTTSALIRDGVDLLKEGARVMASSRELADASKTTSILHETAVKLTEAVEGQLAMLREENEVLRATNSILRNQLTANQLSQSGKAKGDGVTEVINTDKESKITMLHENKSTQKSEPVVVAPNQSDKELGDVIVVPSSKSLQCLEDRVAFLECKADSLQQTCECQEQLISSLQEKIHRQEIRYHDTITKFDETCRSMKVMFEGLKAAISVANADASSTSK